MGEKKHSILIVDDEKSNITILRKILSSEYTIYASTSGQDAIETALEFLPDIILLDIIMPEMDGYEVISALKTHEKTQDIPIILVTGLDNTEAEEKGLSLGAVDYIMKPLRPLIVKLRVRSQIKLLEQFRQQALVTRISHSFLSDTYIDSLIADTLALIGEFMGISTVLLYKLESNDSALVCHGEWLNPELNIETRIGDRIYLNESTVTDVKKLLADSEDGLCIQSKKVKLSHLVNLGNDRIVNYITTPIFIKGEIQATLVFSTTNESKEWSKNEINLAILISDIFAGVFERDAMERQFSIVENSPNLILSITAQAEIKYVNPAVSAVTGYTKYELIAGGLGVIFGKETLSDIKEKYIPDAMSGKTVRFEVDIACKNGKKRILEISTFQTEKTNLGMIIADLTQIRKLELENEKVFLDGLTNIYNRRFFDESIVRIIKSLSRSNSILSLMMIDIDFFKNYNDTYGHSAGDDCLKAVANILKKGIPRADDFVTRYGGEEFVIVLPNTDESGACNVAERLLASIREANMLHEKSDAADHVTLSIGITTGQVTHIHTARDFIGRADEMLYKSKQAGRDRYTFGELLQP